MGSAWVRVAGKYASRPLAMVAIAFGALTAVDSQPVRVVAIQSALRLTVEATVGGLPSVIPVQLEGISLIGPPEYSTQKIRELCPPGSLVILRVPGERLETDAFGVTRAWILRDFPGPVDPAAPPVPAGPAARAGAHRSAIQVELMRAGWAVPEETRPGRMPPQELMQVRAALEEARTRRMGAYSLPGFAPPAPAVPRSDGPPPSGEPRPPLTPVPEPPPPVNPAAGNGF